MSEIFDLGTLSSRTFNRPHPHFCFVNCVGFYYDILNTVLLKLGINEDLIRTFTFASFGIYTLMLIFSVRSLDKNIWEYNPFDNIFTSISSILGIVLMIMAVYVPVLQRLLSTVSLSLIWLVAVILVGFVCLAMIETVKFIIIRRKHTESPLGHRD